LDLVLGIWEFWVPANDPCLKLAGAGMRGSPLRSERWVMGVRVTIEIPYWLDRIRIWPVLVYRRLRYGYPFRRIPLTQGQFAIVGPGDYYRLIKHRWCANRAGPTYYAQRSVRVAGKSVAVMMHRQILPVETGLVVDHINGDGLDNRRANLRAATPAQNRFNQRKYNISATSRFKGVSWSRRDKKWIANITFNKRMICLGYFSDETEAARAYDGAARKYHKEFACINFPPKN